MKRWWVFLTLCTLPALAGPVEDARTLMDQGDHRKAADLLAGSLEQPPANPDALILLTTALNEVGDYKQAVGYGEAAVKAAPESSEAHLQYARALRIKMSNHKMKAMFIVGSYRKELQRALELDPGNVEARLEEIGFLTQAPGIAGGDKEKAKVRIEELKPIDWREAMMMQAMLQRSEDDQAGAIATYEEILARAPADADVRRALAFALQAAGRYADADLHFTRLLGAENPRVVLAARYQLARSRILGEYEAQQAVDHLLTYIEELEEPARGLPSASHAYWRLGLAYEQLDRNDDARRALERALELDPENTEAKKALKELKAAKRT